MGLIFGILMHHIYAKFRLESELEAFQQIELQNKNKVCTCFCPKIKEVMDDTSGKKDSLFESVFLYQGVCDTVFIEPELRNIGGGQAFHRDVLRNLEPCWESICSPDLGHLDSLKSYVEKRFKKLGYLWVRGRFGHCREFPENCKITLVKKKYESQNRFFDTSSYDVIYKSTIPEIIHASF